MGGKELSVAKSIDRQDALDCPFLMAVSVVQAFLNLSFTISWLAHYVQGEPKRNLAARLGGRIGRRSSMAMAARSCFIYLLLLAILVIVAAQLFLFLIGWGPDKTSSAHEQNHEQKLLTRDEFKQKIMGKTEDEVLAPAGRPSTTSQEASMSYWHYADRTKDPLTGEADSDVQVVFQHGRVVAVNY